jgi:hypothetical protein
MGWIGNSRSTPNANKVEEVRQKLKQERANAQPRRGSRSLMGEEGTHLQLARASEEPEERPPEPPHHGRPRRGGSSRGRMPSSSRHLDMAASTPSPSSLLPSSARLFQVPSGEGQQGSSGGRPEKWRAENGFAFVRDILYLFLASNKGVVSESFRPVPNIITLFHCCPINFHQSIETS